jgi:hypothetical protein
LESEHPKNSRGTPNLAGSELLPRISYFFPDFDITFGYIKQYKKKMKQIKLFEEFMDSPKYSGMATNPSDGGEYVTCIYSDGGWNAAGILTPDQEKYVQDLQRKDPGVTVEYISVNGSGSFLFLSGLGGGFQICNDGDMYDSKDGFVCPILSYKLYVMSSGGHTVNFQIIDPKDIFNL